MKARMDPSRGGTDDGYFRTGGLDTAKYRRDYHKDKKAGMYMGDEDDGLGLSDTSVQGDGIQMKFISRKPGALLAGKDRKTRKT